MSAERLSKLQRFILGQIAMAPGGLYHRDYIARDFYGLVRPPRVWGRYPRRPAEVVKKARSAAVAIARSIAVLKKRGWITERASYYLTTEERRAYDFHWGGGPTALSLTDLGKEKARIVNTKSMASTVNSGTRGPRVNSKRGARP